MSGYQIHHLAADVLRLAEVFDHPRAAVEERGHLAGNAGQKQQPVRQPRRDGVRQLQVLPGRYGLLP